LKIALLTSSRADYGIYFPLIKQLVKEQEFELDIIAFGTHNSLFYGETVKQIEADGFVVKHIVQTMILGEGPESVTDSMGLTFLKFSKIWAIEKYKLCIVLGDRYEMFAAAYSTIAFNIPIAHISGGEQTIGAIDNSFRDALTVLSQYHFTSTELYAKRVSQIKGTEENIYNVGALSIDNMRRLKLLTKEEFNTQFNIDLNQPSILITFHPETVSYLKNEYYVQELISALEEVKNYKIIITMPNADTMGGIIRNHLTRFIERTPNSVGVESFGMIGYLSCMKYASFMLGNSSSGFVEASFFPKYVVNLGDRQTGRILTGNIFNCKIEKLEILKAISAFENFDVGKPVDIYGDGTAANKIVAILKNLRRD
jgi:GDP/UDP-N,N'-diacetylbacillosamine 2-epimerase (hydrolysing)